MTRRIKNTKLPVSIDKFCSYIIILYVFLSLESIFCGFRLICLDNFSQSIFFCLKKCMFMILKSTKIDSTGQNKTTSTFAAWKIRIFLTNCLVLN